MRIPLKSFFPRVKNSLSIYIKKIYNFNEMNFDWSINEQIIRKFPIKFAKKKEDEKVKKKRHNNIEKLEFTFEFSLNQFSC